jgi:hypothetical protein
MMHPSDVAYVRLVLERTPIRLASRGLASRGFLRCALVLTIAACSPANHGIGADGANQDGNVPVSELDPDFGPEGQPVCTSAHFCLEFPSATYQSMTAIAATPAGGLYAVGANGTLLHSHSGGASWATVPVPTTASLTAVVVAPSTVLVAGVNGTMLRLVDGHFVADSIDANASFAALYAAADNDIWAVGTEANAGAVLHWDGGAWSHAQDASLPPLYAVAGSSANDVWVGGGSFQSIALYRHMNGGWQAAPDGVSSTSAEGPIRALLVESPTAIHVATDGVNFRDLLLFDGARWSDEDQQLIFSASAQVVSLVAAPNGDIWAVSDPPYVRSGTQWTAITTVPVLGASIQGVAWSQATPVVAGDHGVLGPYAKAQGPFSGIVNGKAFGAANVVLAYHGLYVESASHVFTELASDYRMQWLGANSTTDIAALAVDPGMDATDPYSYVAAYHSSGGVATQAFLQMPLRGDYAVGLAYGENGDLWWAQPASPGAQWRLGKLARGATSWSEVKCNGSSLSGASQLWIGGNDALLRTDTGPQVKLYHLAGSSCTALTANFYWSNDRAIGGSSYNNLWVLDGSTAAIGHWNGTTFSSARATPDVYYSLLYFSDNNMWLAGEGNANGGNTRVAHWDGTHFATYDVGTDIVFMSLWGTDAEHVWIGDSSGRIFRFVP